MYATLFRREGEKGIMNHVMAWWHGAYPPQIAYSLLLKQPVRA